MTRSVHTDPWAIRAAGRQRRPWDTRAAPDGRAAYARLRVLKCSAGIVATGQSSGTRIRQRIVEAPLQTESCRPVTRADMVAVLKVVGPGASFGHRLPRKSNAALVVGNERHGIAHEVQARANSALEIPMAARGINCLNIWPRLPASRSTPSRVARWRPCRFILIQSAAARTCCWWAPAIISSWAQRFAPPAHWVGPTCRLMIGSTPGLEWTAPLDPRGTASGGAPVTNSPAFSGSW
jgi:hypothetical protein